MSNLTKQFFDIVVLQNPVQEPWLDLATHLGVIQAHAKNQNTITSGICMALVLQGYRPYRRIMSEPDWAELCEIYNRLVRAIEAENGKFPRSGMPRLAMNLKRIGVL